MFKRYLEELKKVNILSLDEEILLWQKYSDGDQSARSELIICYQPLVFKTAMSFNLPSEQALELIQEGTVGLIEAVETFDYKKKVAFSLFSIHRIRGRMLDYLKSTCDKKSLSLDFPISDKNILSDLIVDKSAGPEELIEENFLQQKVNQMINRLPEKEQKVLQGLYIEQLSACDMAKTINVSQTHIYRLQKKAVKRIRGMLSKFIHDIKM